MNILLINVPSRRGVGGKVLPLGLLYVGGIIERAGHSPSIFDPYNTDPELKKFDEGDYSELDKLIRECSPEIIGFGGIASSYGRTKKISEYIHQKYPAIFQIAGGPLASLYKMILTSTHITLVFHGETENTLPQLLKKIENNQDWSEISGISFRRDGQIIRNVLSPQIENLDTVPLPSYHLIDLKRYCTTIFNVIDTFVEDRHKSFDLDRVLRRISSDGSVIPVITSRGCTNKCSFCYRHMKGFRQHSVAYVIDHIKFLKSQYGIRGFDFADELFNFNKKWVLEFCDALDRENLDIYYVILGARVDRMDREMLQRLKDTGCIAINYGQESGSDTILKEFRKGVTSEKNKETTLLTKEMGLICPVQIVIGSPVETQKTIDETIRFLIEVDAGKPSVNYLLPFPETPIWDYVMENGLIPDIDKYLDNVADFGGSPLVNLTKVPYKRWRSWNLQIKSEIRLRVYRRNNQVLKYIVMLPVIRTGIVLYRLAPIRLINFMKTILINR